MGLTKFVVTILFVLLFTVISSNAAEISILEIPGQKVSFVIFKGEITAGDAQKFVETVRDLDRVTVSLESPGGLVDEALQIGAEIRSRNFATMVLPDAGCYSACGLLWISGARRYMSSTSQIGFHAAYLNDNGVLKESGVSNAEIGSFLTHLGLRIEAIRFFTTAGPTELLQLTLDRARALGIEVYEQNGTEVVTPEQKPVADVYVNRFVAFAFLKAKCLTLLQPQTLAIENGIKEAFARGNAIVGAEQWANLMTLRLEAVKLDLNTKGTLLRCIEVEADVRSQGIATGIGGPSFNCSASLSETEQAICTDKNLWPKDRAISSIYLYLRSKNNSTLRKSLLSDQRKWLKLRGNCRDNVNCLNETLDKKLFELREIEISD